VAKERTAKDYEAMLVESTRQALAIARRTIAPARITVREAVVAPPPPFGAKRIQRARAKLGFSQAVFAHALNVSPATVRAWEQGSREPDGAAVRLLEITDQYPRLLASKVRHVSEAPARYTARKRAETSRNRK
jgi:putative transcriptional regulator